MSKSLLDALNNIYLSHNGDSLKGARNLIESLDRLNSIIPAQEDVDKLLARVEKNQEYIAWDKIINDIRNQNLGNYSIGDMIESPWTDITTGEKYQNPWNIVHLSDAEVLSETAAAEGEELQVKTAPGMWLQTKYAQLKDVQFSHPRAAVKCPEGLPAGQYYITIGAKLNNNLPANTIISFSLINDIPVDGRIFVLNLGNAADTRKVQVYAADGKTILEEATPGNTAEGTSLGTMALNTRTENLSSIYEAAYGYNNWAMSAIRQYLNSDAGIGEWWTAQDGWDIAPSQLDQIPGYLTGMTQEMKNAITQVKVVTKANTVTDGGVDLVTYDKVILPSLGQMFITVQAEGQGTAFDYWKEMKGDDTPFAYYPTVYDAYPFYGIENHDKKVNTWLRSAYRGLAGRVWFVSSGGIVNSTYAFGALRAFPTIYIC